MGTDWILSFCGEVGITACLWTSPSISEVAVGNQQ